MNTVRSHFADLGVSEKLRTDGAPQFTSMKFQKFLKKFGVIHERSSPYYPQSNGHTEAAVKPMKQLIAKTTTNGNLNNDEYCAGLLEYKNTPMRGTLSPAEIVFGHPLISLVPAHHSTFANRWKACKETFEESISKYKEIRKNFYNEKIRDLQSVKMSLHIYLQDLITKRWNMTGEIVGKNRNRSYLVKTLSGTLLWRNRNFLCLVKMPISHSYTMLKASRNGMSILKRKL